MWDAGSTENTYLGFAHDLAVGADPDDEDELLPDRLLIVGVLYAHVPVGRLGVVQLVAELGEASRSGRRERQLVRAVRLPSSTGFAEADDQGQKEGNVG